MTDKAQAKRAAKCEGKKRPARSDVREESQGAYYLRMFKSFGDDLSKLKTPSWERWRKASSVLTTGFEAANLGGIAYADILDRPEMLLAVECLISDPPELAAAFLRPNPNPVTKGRDKDFRDWIFATFQEYVENDYLKPTGKTTQDTNGRGVLAVWDFPAEGTVAHGDLTRARFFMFPTCFDLGAYWMRTAWARFIENCNLPEFDRLRDWLKINTPPEKESLIIDGALYECEYSESEWIDLNTGENTAPKYGGGGIRAGNLLFNFLDYLRGRQGVATAQGAAGEGGACESDAAAAMELAEREREAAAHRWANRCRIDRGEEDAARALELLHTMPDAARNIGAGVVMMTAGTVNIQTTANPSGIQSTGKTETARNVGKVSQVVMAGFFGVCPSTVKNWENHPKRQAPPKVDGKTYTKDIRENGAGAFIYADRYKATLKGSLKTVGGNKGAGMAAREAAKKWITEHAAALRSEGANLSEWE